MKELHYKNITFEFLEGEVVIPNDFLSKNFIDFDHKGSYDLYSIMGEVTKIECEKILKGDIKIYEGYFEEFKKQNKCTSEDVIKFIESLTPSIYGKVLEKDDKGNITKYELLGVSLCNNPNIDPHVKSIKEQINEQKI